MEAADYLVERQDFIGKLAYLQESPLCNAALVICHMQAQDEGGCDDCGYSQRQPVAPQEFAGPIPGIAGTGLHWSRVEKGADVIRERVHGRVSFGRFMA